MLVETQMQCQEAVRAPRELAGLARRRWGQKLHIWPLWGQGEGPLLPAVRFCLQTLTSVARLGLSLWFLGVCISTWLLGHQAAHRPRASGRRTEWLSNLKKLL